MTASRKSAGSNVTLTTLKRRSAGAWVALTVGKRRSAGAWIDILPAAPDVVALTAHTLTTTSISPNTVTALFRFATAGKLRGTDDGGSLYELTPLAEWLEPENATNAALYEVQATLVSNTGSATMSGTFGTWLQLGVAARDWSASITSTTTSPKSASPVVGFTIRRISDAATMASANVTFNLVLESGA